MTSLRSRRAALGAFAAAAAIPAGIGLANPGAGASPDAALLALRGPLLAAWAETKCVEAEGDDIEPSTEAARAIVERVVALPARTLAGLKVKALACSWCHCGDPFEGTSFRDSPTTDLLLVAGILRDLLAMEVRA